MAFLQKLGSIAKRSAAGSGSSLLQAVRCMSTSKVFVGGPDLSLRPVPLIRSPHLPLHPLVIIITCSVPAGISYGTDENSLGEAFSQYGQVIEGTFLCLVFICFAWI
jgi:heterogeneous nuclear ribonucleoprotein A1/A3